eukprot:TRINITY_DN4005_c0_g1_i1.p1 TRINITY_DN4005_c0_g1~~TRINITY_DN4005_c0_g1_i1.p1  ORF type:complete len:242 (-),score=73.16 TRINITY_DN4005_c0_g1_i1:366-1091(-)
MAATGLSVEEMLQRREMERKAHALRQHALAQRSLASSIALTKHSGASKSSNKNTNTSTNTNTNTSTNTQKPSQKQTQANAKSDRSSNAAARAKAKDESSVRAEKSSKSHSVAPQSVTPSHILTVDVAADLHMDEINKEKVFYEKGAAHAYMDKLREKKAKEEMERQKKLEEEQQKRLAELIESKAAEIKLTMSKNASPKVPNIPEKTKHTPASAIEGDFLFFAFFLNLLYSFNCFLNCLLL